MKRLAATSGFAAFFTLFFLCGKDAAQAAAVCLVSAAAFLFLLLFFLLLRRKPKQLAPVLLALFSVILASAAYWIAYQTQYLPVARFDGAENAHIIGIVTDCRGFSDGRFSYVLQCGTINGEKADCNLLLYSYSDLYVNPGDRVEGTVSTLYGVAEGAYGKYLFAERLFLRAYDMSELTVTPDAQRSFVIWASTWRQTLRSRILQAVGGDEGGLLCGLILGDTSALSLRAENSFTRSGINHIFSVSGFHVSAWSTIPYLMLSAFSVHPAYRALVSSVFVLLVTAVTGFPLSGLRAAFMLLLVYLSTCVRRKSDLFNSLGFSLLVIGLLNPFSGGSLSLLLSAAATSGIALFSDAVFSPVQEWFDQSEIHPVLKQMLLAVLSSVLLSLTITVVMAPLLTYYFGSLSLASPLSNLILAPLTEIAMMTGGLAALIPWRFLIQTAGEICRWLLFGADLVASSPLATVSSELWQLLPAALLGAAVLLVLILCKRKSIAALAAILASVTVLSSLAVGQGGWRRNKPQLTLCDSGGLCLLVCYQGQELMLCADGAGYEAQTMLTEHHIYSLDALFYRDRDAIEVLRENFAPEAVISLGGAVWQSGDFSVASLPDNAGWLIDLPDRRLLFLMDENDRRFDEGADELILPALPAEKSIPEGNITCWIGGSGIDTENLHFLNENPQLKLTGGE